TKEDRIRTCYMQACLAYVEFDAINNSDIRELFDLEDKDKVKASRIIKDTLSAGLIKPLDPKTAPRYMKYIPAWA
ncbi:MAG: transcriptional regulator, partial [Lachnospiraceae bacterium]|nr:transcriptional regulator [Lachnospiraceae bacterium]